MVALQVNPITLQFKSSKASIAEGESGSDECKAKEALVRTGIRTSHAHADTHTHTLDERQFSLNRLVLARTRFLTRQSTQ